MGLKIGAAERLGSEMGRDEREERKDNARLVHEVIHTLAYADRKGRGGLGRE